MKGQSNRYLPKSSWCFSIFSSPGSSSVILAWALMDWTTLTKNIIFFLSLGYQTKIHQKNTIDIYLPKTTGFFERTYRFYAKKTQKKPPRWDGRSTLSWREVGCLHAGPLDLLYHWLFDVTAGESFRNGQKRCFEKSLENEIRSEMNLSLKTMVYILNI